MWGNTFLNLTNKNAYRLNEFTVCYNSKRCHTVRKGPQSLRPVSPTSSNGCYLDSTSVLIIIIAFKGAIRDFFYNLLTESRTVSNTYAQVAQAQPCANHVQHIERLSRSIVMLRAIWYEGTAQLLSWTELKSHLFELYFVGLIIKPMKEGRKPEYPEKTPGDELQKMPHTIARRFKP